MMTMEGPKLLEYNVRFGDPEAQVVLPRLSSDLCEQLASAADGRLVDDTPTFVDEAAVCVVVASPGYPEAPRTGAPIDGIEEVSAEDGIEVFCAGVAREGDDRLVTAGGRVLDVVGFGPTIGAARLRAYDGLRRISFPGMHYRNDIAAAAAKEEQSQ
jgi:phosphoribosylamine--glycine ligase